MPSKKKARHTFYIRNMRISIVFALIVSTALTSFKAEETVSIAKLKYGGGGDWYANRTALPNLASFCNKEIGTDISPQDEVVEVGSKELFNFPYIYMTGHGNVVFSKAEAANLRSYLIAGGFLHIDDNYGLDEYIRPQMKLVFPELEFVELPFSHAIYHQQYDFPDGLPKIHEHDGKAPQGFGLIYEGRLLCFYDYECDLGNGWEDPGIYNDSEETRQKALRMGANIIQYAFTH